METILFFGGLYNVAFALFHTGFWKIFHWKSDLNKISFVNQGIIQILNIQIIWYFIMTAVIFFMFPTELLNTELGNWFLLGTSFFWLIRTVQQFIFLRANHVKIHFLTIIFLIGTILYAITVFFK